VLVKTVVDFSRQGVKEPLAFKARVVQSIFKEVYYEKEL
jgi:hypothetical protein